VTESDGTSSDVDFLVVETEDLFSGNSDNGECLVELPEINVVLGETSGLEDLGDGKSRSGREIHGVTSGIGVS
jgi:hypothetical protein